MELDWCENPAEKCKMRNRKSQIANRKSQNHKVDHVVHMGCHRCLLKWFLDGILLPRIHFSRREIFWVLLTSDWCDVEIACCQQKEQMICMERRQEAEIIWGKRFFILHRVWDRPFAVYIESGYHIQAIIKLPTNPFSARPVFHY